MPQSKTVLKGSPPNFKSNGIQVAFLTDQFILRASIDTGRLVPSERNNNRYNICLIIQYINV